jgi:spore maturation protein SpmA
MVLNYIWVSFFLVAFIVALVKLVFFQDVTVFPAMLTSMFESARTGFEISIGLTGVMTFWLGLMKVGEKGGILPILSRAVGPFFARLFPGVPREHPAMGSIIMNFSANILGLDNAATPLGLKAMKELQEVNPDKDTASDAQIMFLVLNASGLTVIPLAIIADRVTLGSGNPTAIFIPTLIATFCSTMVGVAYLAYRQKINLLDRVMLTYLLGLSALVGLTVWYFSSLPQDQLQQQSTLVTSVIILSIVIWILSLGVRSKIPVFETFIEGAKEGFEIAVKVIPYLVAMLVGISLFRASGTLNVITDGIKMAVVAMSLDAAFVDALPVAFLKPLSASAARTMMIAVSKEFGVDSFAGNLASVIRGCAETTFYIIAVYFGSVNIRKTRYAVSGGLIADVAGFTASIVVAYMFFR